MSSLPSLPSRKTIFGKAFLAELKRGNVQQAILFARAFLAQKDEPRHYLIEECLVPLLAY